MFCDHLGSSFLGGMLVMRCIGRFAFPIYALLLAEGFRHMKDDRERVSRHLMGYVFLALVSEFCYDLLECKPLTISGMAGTQNAIITLLLAFLGLIAIDRWKKKPLYMWSAILLTALANYLIMSNYKFVGVLLVYAFYFYLNHMEGKNYLQRFLMLFGIFMLYIPIYHFARYNFSPELFVEKLDVNNMWWYLTHILIVLALAAYTGKLGPQPKPFRKVYRWFYPAHLFILGIFWQMV